MFKKDKKKKQNRQIYFSILSSPQAQGSLKWGSQITDGRLQSDKIKKFFYGK